MKMNENFMDGLQLLAIKKQKNYNLVAILTMIALTGIMIVLLFSTILPWHNLLWTVIFNIAILIGIYNIINEIFFPEQYNIYLFIVPEDYSGWNMLYLISTCVGYDAEKNLISIKLSNKVEKACSKYLNM